MILIQHTLISDDLFEEPFICDLSQCKGRWWFHIFISIAFGI